LSCPRREAPRPSAWALGTGNGALDTGAIATSTWYHVWLIARSDTGVVDVLVSTSATAPTMPTSYDRKRRIGSLKTNGSSQWTLFQQNGDEFLLDTPVLDVDISNLSTSAATQTLASVPTGVVVDALANVGIQSTSVGINVYLSALSVSDLAPSNTVAPGASLRTLVTSVANWQSGLKIRTNTSAQVRARADASSTTLRMATLGWVDRRGK
jgi:hypothetical protein